ncbi:uncharacterized protein KGF55_001779 [Candida pseudojiufengensis]|uniref:uncharacterized protein n=1 Tax=Candida pseudojiufengensis TaxID=497109 RepID=UPI0022240F4E|nr:uncharacterized protein KGF55_001779 [Candida pseudojiufengensis]KAI5964710.1 hypothetical protein KGF55_001779 [Candida pseudojiufengensis]
MLITEVRRYNVAFQLLRISFKNRNVRFNSNSVKPNTLLYNLSNYQSTFPNDETINKAISTVKTIITKKPQPQVFKIGVLYDSKQVEQSSKLIEVLLADPLASNNQIWFEKIVKRHGLGKFLFGEFKTELIDENPDSDCSNQFELPSPILSGLYRLRYGSEPDLTQNDLIIEEIDDSEHVNQIDSFTYFIYVTNQFKTSRSELQDPLRNRILLKVIDNVEYSPKSSESSPISLDPAVHTHVIKINSNLAYNGITNFIDNDIRATDDYLDSMTQSNVHQLFKFIDYFARTDNIITWYMEKIKSLIQDKLDVFNTSFENNLTTTKSDIDNYMQLVNTELQFDFEPKTRNFIKKNLTWWKLYYKNDNVEYDLKDFFNKNFMNKSIENYNFLKGKILDTKEVDNNPLLNLKNDVINKVIGTTVQPEVVSILSKAFIYYQLPISVISGLAFQFFDFSANSCIALLSLGWVLGFNQVSKQWLAFMNKWCKNLNEDIRLTLTRDCIEGLSKEANDQIDKVKQEAKIRQKILTEIESNK